jgi:hypothetical protein
MTDNVARKFVVDAWNSRRLYPEPELKLLRSPIIDSKEPIPPGCLAWRTGTTTPVFLFGS